MMRRFREPTRPDAPVLGLTESGEDCVLIVADLGEVAYKRDQAESLAKRLDAAAAMVRDYA